MSGNQNAPAAPAAATMPPEVAAMTAAQAAKLVKRPVTELVDGKDADGKPAKIEKTKLVSVSADEVLAHKDYGSHVVVVTTDGQKLTNAVEA